MRKYNLIFKGLLSCLLIGCLFSVCSAATTAQGWNVLNQLREQGRTDEEIKAAIEDLGYSADDYFPTKSSSTTNSSSRSTSTSNTTTSYNNKNTTQQGRDVLNKLRKEGWTDEEIKATMEDLGLDYKSYFPGSSSSSNSELVYTSRSCKVYNIEYMDVLGVYSSPDLKKKEYFINTDYFKRYIDSKNPQQYNCPTNEGRIATFYDDKSNSSDRYTAPNGKVYFITNQNGRYSSNELNNSKSFSSINELKNYIRDRNPLIWMGRSQSSSQRTSQTSAIERIHQTIMHGSATEENSSKEEELENSEEAKRQRDIVRKNDISQIHTHIITFRYDNNKTRPGMKNNDATKGVTMATIAKDLETAGLTYVPFDPISSNTVSGLGTIKGIGEYTYIVTKSNGVKNAGFVLMAKPETEEGANRVVCNGENNFDNGYITNSTDINDIQYCTSFIKTNYCKRDNQGRSNTQKCYYSDDSQLRHILTY